MALPSSMGMCPEAALAQILSAVKRSTLSPVENLGPQIKKKVTTGVVLFIPQIDILLRRLPHLTAVYLVDRLQCLMHDLVAETVYCALPLTDSSVSLNDLSQAVSQPARRLLLVATINKGSTRSPPVRNYIPLSVSSTPPQRIPDTRVTSGNGVLITSSTSTHGSAATRRSKENWSPTRPVDPIFGRFIVVRNTFVFVGLLLILSCSFRREINGSLDNSLWSSRGRFYLIPLKSDRPLNSVPSTRVVRCSIDDSPPSVRVLVRPGSCALLFIPLKLSGLDQFISGHNH